MALFSGKPNRAYSELVLEGAWPEIDSAELMLQAEQELKAAKEVEEAARGTRRVAGDDFIETCSGRFGDATWLGYQSDADGQDAKWFPQGIRRDAQHRG